MWSEMCRFGSNGKICGVKCVSEDDRKVCGVKCEDGGSVCGVKYVN
ncbi:hypothetical protein AVEN_210400-1, partial [Araneus ventricosus]